MTVLEHIKQLSEALSPDEKQSLAAYLSSRESGNREPRDLYGIWKDGFQSDFNIDAALREIRSEWQRVQR